MYRYLHMYTYACWCVRVHIGIYRYIHMITICTLCIYTYIYVYIHAFVYICQHIYVYVNICIYICVCICLHTYVYSLTHPHVYIYTCKHTYIQTHFKRASKWARGSKEQTQTVCFCVREIERACTTLACVSVYVCVWESVTHVCVYYDISMCLHFCVYTYYIFMHTLTYRYTYTHTHMDMRSGRGWCMLVCLCLCIYAYAQITLNEEAGHIRGWRRVIFRKRALQFVALFAKNDLQLEASYGSSSPCTLIFRPVGCLICRSFFSKEPLIIGLFCGKWPVKIRHAMGLRLPVHVSLCLYMYAYTQITLNEEAARAHYTYCKPHCNTLQHTATHCNTLQHTATHCNTLQHTH